MDSLQADIDLLESSDASLGQLAPAAEDGLARLRAEVACLLGSDWRGGAAAGFAAGWQEWQRGVDDLLTALRGLGAFLGESGRAYTRVIEP